MKNIITVIILCFLFPFCGYGQTTFVDNDLFANAITDYISYSGNLKLQVFTMKSNLEGKMVIGDKKNPSAHAPELIDLKNNLKFDDEMVFGFGINWQYAARTSVDISYSQLEQDSFLNFARAFKGKHFKANSKFEIKNRWVDIAFQKKLYRTQSFDTERLNLSSVVGIKTVNILITGRGEESGTMDKHLYASWEKTFPMPYLGLNGSMRLGRSAEAKAYCTYGSFPTTDSYKADHYELGFNLILDMHRKEQGNVVQLDIGYKKFEYDIDGNGNGVLFKFSGPILFCNVIF